MEKINERELHELFEGLKNENDNTKNFNNLYENYYKLVYGIVFSILKNKENSEDVSQTVFSKIYQLPKEKLPDKFEASWLYKVSKNETLQYIRKMKNEASFEEIYDMSDENSNIDEVIDVETYKSMIAGLSEKEKEIVSLKVLSQFTFKKIGQMLNMPTGTVQWSYYKAVNSLRISISSLAGFVLTFILGIVTTKSKIKSSTVINNENKKNNELKTEINHEETGTSYYNDGSYKGTTAIDNLITSIESSTKNEIKEETVKKESTKNDSSINIGFFSVSIVFFIIFIIFFKKYQQKRKNKASK